MSKVTDLLEKFEDVFKPASEEELHNRIENMSEEELAEYISEEVLPSLKIREYNDFLTAYGAFDNEAVQEVLETWLEKYMEDLNKDDLIEFMETAKAIKRRGEKRK